LRRLFAARFAGYRCRLRSGEATCSGAIAEAALVLTIAIFLADSGSRPPTGARRSVKTAVLIGRIAQAAPPYQALPWAKLSDCSKSAATGFHFRYGFKRLITDGLSRTLLGALYIKPASAWPLSLPTRGLPDLNDATGGSPTEVSLGSRAALWRSAVSVGSAFSTGHRRTPLALVGHAYGRRRVSVQAIACAAGDVAYSLPSRSWIRPARGPHCHRGRGRPAKGSHEQVSGTRTQRHRASASASWLWLPARPDRNLIWRAPTIARTISASQCCAISVLAVPRVGKPGDPVLISAQSRPPAC
jgi:hypothetical protein